MSTSRTTYFSLQYSSSIHMQRRIHIVTGVVLLLSLSYCRSQGPTYHARPSVIKEATSLIGSPYRYAGQSPRGFDCSGLVKYVYAKEGIELSGGSRHIYEQVQTIPLAKAGPGDLLFFKQRGNIDHIALLEKQSDGAVWVIHSTSSRGVIRENYKSSPYWSSRFFRAGRVSP